jgi:hypothetical protein
MRAEDLEKKEPMAAHGFTVLTPKQETAYDKMIQEKQMSVCGGCGNERPAYPVPILPNQNVPSETGKKNSKR